MNFLAHMYEFTFSESVPLHLSGCPAAPSVVLWSLMLLFFIVHDKRLKPSSCSACLSSAIPRTLRCSNQVDLTTSYMILLSLRIWSVHLWQSHPGIYTAFLLVFKLQWTFSPSFHYSSKVPQTQQQEVCCPVHWRSRVMRQRHNPAWSDQVTTAHTMAWRSGHIPS